MSQVIRTNPDWQLLLEDFRLQAFAACSKLEAAIQGATEAPPLKLSEALEDAANEYLDLVDQIGALHSHHFAGGKGGQKVIEAEGVLKPAVILAEYFAQPVED